MEYIIREMDISDYKQVMTLWQSTPGICIRSTDSAENTQRYLERNPGLSFVAIADGQLIGTIQAGHDGRRGYLQHLAVSSNWRGRGVGRQLVEASLEALANEGIIKSHLFVLPDNERALAFWEHLGWQLRDDLVMFSINRSDDCNA